MEYYNGVLYKMAILETKTKEYEIEHISTTEIIEKLDLAWPPQGL